MTFRSVALIGFGEVGRILAEDLVGVGVTEVSAFDILFDSQGGGTVIAALGLPVRAAPNAAAAVRGAELVVSAVTAAADLDAAQSVAGTLESGAFFLDLNSASPELKRASATVIDTAGGRYVEAAVMTPFPPKRIASAMLLGGPHAKAFLARAEPLGFKARVFSETVGQASATKMCRSVLVKGMEALLIESLLAARHFGVEETVLASLADLFPVGDWPGLARYMISRALEHGARRAEEMREAARTVHDAGVDPLLSRSIAERQDWAAAYRYASGEPNLAAMLDALRGAAAPPAA